MSQVSRPDEARQGHPCELRLESGDLRLAYAPNELPQPQVVFAFGLLNTKPLLNRLVS